MKEGIQGMVYKGKKESDVMRIQSKQLSEEEIKNINLVKELGSSFYRVLEARVPSGREFSIAKTKLEEAVMWAVKGISG